MGGRGAASGVSNGSYRYGMEYHAVLQVDNIKIVAKNDGAAVLPQDTMSADANRVYVIANKSGDIKSIGFYAKDGRLRRQIDLDHTHGGKSPHVHEGYDHSVREIKMTKSDWSYYRKVVRLWSQIS